MLLATLLTVALLLPADIGDDVFFPSDVAAEKHFRAEGYAMCLREMRESPIWGVPLADDRETYRLLWLRTFHQPVAVRLDISADRTSVLTLKTLTGAAGYETGGLDKDKTRRINARKTAEFLRRVNEAEFWQLPAVLPVQEDFYKDGVQYVGEVRLDGAQWVLEGARKDQYTVVRRWSSEVLEDDDFREAALCLLRLSGVSLKHVY